MKAIGKIYLAWRKGRSSRRIIVGVIKKNATEGVRFKYYSKGVSAAQNDGFTPYIDFPDTSKEYKENVLEVFSKRLIKSERSDIQKYHDFWAIDPKFKDDSYYLLAYTQGMLSTDNFEFLADFHPIKDLKFVSEISGLSHFKINSNCLEVGDLLTYQLEKENPNDKNAVKVFKGKKEIGYIKVIHSRVFHKNLRTPLKIVVKSIDKNGILNRVFIEISI